MSERPGIVGLLFLPGIVAGMLLAGVVLVAGDALFPDAFKILFPQKTPFFVLAIAITVTSTIGFVNLISPPKDSKHKNNFRSGGIDDL